LLPVEPTVYPEDLLTRPLPPDETPECWWALHTRPRSEKALARRFLSREMAFFLPIQERQWRKHGRLFRSHVPLFPAYILLHGDDEARTTALETNLVARCLPVADQRQLQEDLGRVHRLLCSGAPLTPEERLQPGMPVEIISGSMEGLRGK